MQRLQGFEHWYRSSSLAVQVAVAAGTVILVCGCCGILGAIGNRGDTTPTIAGVAQATATTAHQEATATAPTNAAALAYRSVVLTDLAPLEADFTKIGTDCGAQDIAACRTDAQAVHDDATIFLHDLDAHPAPSCLSAADAQLREALTNYINGSTLQVQGIDNVNASDITTGTSMVDTGNTEIGHAATAVSSAQC